MDERLDMAFERWAKRNEELGRVIVVDRSALRALSANSARGSLRWFAAGLWVELLLAIVPVVWLGNFAAGAVHAPIEFASAVVLDVFAILLLANVAMQLATLRSIDYDGPVTRVQAALERVRLLRLRAARGIFVFAVFAWVPLCIVGFAALFGIDVAATFDRTWLIVNVIVGVAFVPFAIWISRLLETRASSNAVWQYVVRTIAGSNLNAALGSIDRIAEFRRETP
jgi:hypothetical protein